jgi:hypothetical protein
MRPPPAPSDPLCKFCLERGIVTAANVVDHVEPHKGDWTAFVTGAYRKVKASFESFGLTDVTP